MFLLVLEREEWRKRERKKENYQSVVSCTCPWSGIKPKTQLHAWKWTLSPFGVQDNTRTNQATPAGPSEF